MSETQQPKPITAWAAFDEDGPLFATIRGTPESAMDAAVTRMCGTLWDELKAVGVRIAKIEIREVTE